MITIANYLYSIIYSEVYKKEDWQNWADQLIINNDNLDIWIYDLSIAENNDVVYKLLSDRMLDEIGEVKLNYSLTETIHGYYYYRYRNRELNLYELLTSAGGVSDANQAGGVDCEYFYDKLNQIDADSAIIYKSKFMEEINNYFLPFYNEALYQKKIIENIQYKDIVFDGC